MEPTYVGGESTTTDYPFTLQLLPFFASICNECLDLQQRWIRCKL
jgi:hypothetical protein